MKFIFLLTMFLKVYWFDFPNNLIIRKQYSGIVIGTLCDDLAVRNEFGEIIRLKNSQVVTSEFVDIKEGVL